MKKSMTQKEMKRVVTDLIAKYGKIEAIRQIKVKIEHPKFSYKFCFLCDLYNSGIKKCTKCPSKEEMAQL